MQNSRPVIAFALLRQCSEQLQTDLLGGVAILIRPLVSDLANQLYDARVLAERMATSYGISFPPAALESFTERLVTAGVLRVERAPGGPSRAIYSVQDGGVSIDEDEERNFQEILDEFLSRSEKLLTAADIKIDQDKLTTGFLHHLATLDFSAIRAKPIVKREAAGTIIGPAMKEQIALSKELEEHAIIDSLVASYVNHLSVNNEQRLALLSKVADGALGAELVMDLQAPSSVQRLTSTTVIIDTPSILSFLDLSSQQDTVDAKELFLQIIQSGAKIAAFQHSIEEAEGVLRAINSARSAGDAYGPSIHRLSNSTFRAYFDSMIGAVSRVWSQTHHFEIIQETATHYYKNFTEADEQRLLAQLRTSMYDRVLTRERDAKSVAETMRRLGGAHIPVSSISSCKFMFATPNGALQRRAAKFLRENGLVADGEFAPIVTARYLSGLCWLICGGKSSQSPTVAKLLSNCAAALRLRPELAERTKRFLAEVDPEKAKHFEALMTSERAAQYLVEVTFGNPELITANNVEDIFEEVQRRAAEKVAKEKDEFYISKISDLNEQMEIAERTESDLRGQLVEIQMEADVRKSEVRGLSDEAKALRQQQVEQEQTLAQQATHIGGLESQISQLTRSAGQVAAQLGRQRDRAVISARRHSRRILLAIRVLGALALFLATWLLGYVDKTLIPQLAIDSQKTANIALISCQALLAVSGLSLLLDLFSKPMARLGERLYRDRLRTLGVEDEPS